MHKEKNANFAKEAPGQEAILQPSFCETITQTIEPFTVFGCIINVFLFYKALIWVSARF